MRGALKLLVAIAVLVVSRGAAALECVEYGSVASSGASFLVDTTNLGDEPQAMEVKLQLRLAFMPCSSHYMEGTNEHTCRVDCSD
jgi:hypothetical protein